MMNRWGNDDRGPGGDPSWLGGRDRGTGAPQGSSESAGWSSDFASEAERPDSDFGGSRGPQAAEQMAPRFGDVSGDDARERDREADSPWMASFTGQDAEGSGSSRSTLSRVLGTVVPILSVVIFGFIALRIFGGGHAFGGFGGFGAWWLFLFIIPIISRVVRRIRKHLGD